MNDFEKEVISRLTKIETKIDNIKKIEENAMTALHKSNENEKDINEIKESLKWSWRTIIGVIIGYIINLIFNIRGGS